MWVICAVLMHLDTFLVALSTVFIVLSRLSEMLVNCTKIDIILILIIHRMFRMKLGLNGILAIVSYLKDCINIQKLEYVHAI